MANISYGKTQMMWAKAAQSMVAGEGHSETVMDVLHARAMRHFGDGLRQYLTVRLADAAMAEHIYNEVHRSASVWPTERLIQPPGAKAQLYGLARRLANQALEAERSMTRSRNSLPWRPPREDVPSSYVRALSYFRSGLDPVDAELLELYFVRELSFEEIAFVVDRPLSEIESDMARLIPHAQEIVGEAPPSKMGGLAGAMIEAFAMGPHLGAAEVTTHVEEEERPPLPTGTLVGGRYQVETRAGTGSFGDVYRCNDSEVEGHVVALKLLHHAAISEKARASALRELRLIASVFHPSIVLFKDHGWFEDRLWFVMPWYHGETLEDRINRAPLSRAEARHIFEPLARALAAMHAAGVRHQDIKPENIFLAHTSSFGLGFEDNVLPVLLDLGVAATEAEVFLAGTPMYFAPEVAAPFASVPNSKEITGKADIFSLALALRNALEPDTQEEVEGGAIEAFVRHRVQNIPEFPRGDQLKYLLPSFKRWLAVDPDERPTAEEFADELSILTRPEERRERRLRTLRWLVPAVVAIAVSFAAVVMLFSKQAEIQRLQAQRARTEAASLKGDLNALEEDITDLRQQYQSSKYTRQQLADKLADAEGEVRALSARFDRVSAQRRALQKSLEEEESKVKDLSSKLETTQISLQQETTRANQLRTDLGSAKSQITSLSADLQGAQRNVSRLETDLEKSKVQQNSLRGDLQSARSDLAAEKARARRIESDLEKANAGQRNAEREVADLRRTVQRLQRELDALRRAGSPARTP
ncbi:MAG: protein kinase [Myxococcales bacterium]|nr:MAG: protein kinase [Myxococcales bacterium]